MSTRYSGVTKRIKGTTSTAGATAFDELDYISI